MMPKESVPYQALCTAYYDLDKPTAPTDALQVYLQYAAAAQGPILEPMCGSGRFLIPFLEHGYQVDGFDYSKHMLDKCRERVCALNLTSRLTEATFENFATVETYNLIFIPSGSFNLLTTIEQVHTALQLIFRHLRSGGKFVFEFITAADITDSNGIWKGSWVTRADNAKIVLSKLDQFDAGTGINTTLCRYELWQNNQIIQTEVEDFRLLLYTPAEIEQLLTQHGFRVLNKWQAEPHTQNLATDTDAMILYECIKDQPEIAEM